MSEEREIEKQLRAAAEQRRKAAGGKFELHPASRRLLQGEVVRIRGAKSAPARPVFWPRFAWGTSMLAVLAVGIWVLVSSQKKSEIISLARVTGDRSQNAVAAKDAQRTLAEPRTDSRPAQVAPTSEAKAMAVASFDRPKSGAIPTPAAAVVMPALREFAASLPPAVEMDRTKTEPALGIAGSGGTTTQEQTAHYNFSNAITKKRGIANRVELGFASAPPTTKRDPSSTVEPDMLKSFQIELAGNRIRILDRDGSVYDGTMVADTRVMDAMEASQSSNTKLESLTKSSGASAVQSAPLANEDHKLLQQNFRFVASGTNFSLGQRVTIKGEFSADAGAADKSSFNEQNMSVPAMNAKLQNNVGLSNGRILGRAVTADGQVIEMNASQMPTK